MAVQADLHVHSKYSRHPSEWFLQRIGTRESYTELEEIYRAAKARGMRFVTVTDHNTIEGAMKLNALHPGDTFVSVEVTTYFPENRCKIHVLIFDVSPGEFERIQAARSNIYHLRDYIRERGLAYSVAHATFSINGKLTIETLEKLILLFDVFEGINGARSPGSNRAWTEILGRLTPADIRRLCREHGIEPFGPQPWIKGFTGGSDDHSGLFIGDSYTVCDCRSLAGFLEALKQKKTFASGHNNNYKAMAFAIYKIAYDFSKHNAPRSSGGLVTLVNRMLFDNEDSGWKGWYARRKLKRQKNGSDRILARFFVDLMNSGSRGLRLKAREKIDRIYEHIADMTDDYFRTILSSLENDLRTGSPERLLRNFSASLPAVFLSIPFFSTLKHLHANRALIDRLKHRFGQLFPRDSRKILWFTDTLSHSNGVALMMRQLAWRPKTLLPSLKIVAPSPEIVKIHGMPDRFLSLDPVYSFTPPFYPGLSLHLPSILKSLDRIYIENPDRIVISTPGPFGFLAILASRLLGIPASATAHADIPEIMHHLLGDDMMGSLAESVLRWYTGFFKTHHVFSEKSRDRVIRMGAEPSRVRVHRPALDREFFTPSKSPPEFLRHKHHLYPGFTLLYAGRISPEKNWRLAAEAYLGIVANRPEVQFLVVGDGPGFDDFRGMLAACPRALFRKTFSRTDLRDFMWLSTLLLFPSTLDHLGRIVLEAGACGLPALVSLESGAGQYIRDGENGFTAKENRPAHWTQRIETFLERVSDHPDRLLEMQAHCRRAALAFPGWESVFCELLDERETEEAEPGTSPFDTVPASFRRPETAPYSPLPA